MSEHFDREWLGLREPVDHAARPASLADALAEWVVRVRGAHEAPLRVLDPGAGTGSNLRWLAPRLPDPQLWTLVDHDASLLDTARRDAGGERVEHLRVEDFAAAPPALPGAAPDPLLVTGAALLDLVSARWLDALVAACAARGAAVLFAPVCARRGTGGRPVTLYVRQPGAGRSLSHEKTIRHCGLPGPVRV